MVRRFLSRVSEDILLLTLLLVLPLLYWLSPVPLTALPSLVDWQTVSALAGLMVLSRSLEDSGYLLAAGRRLLAAMGSERGLAAFLVLFAAGLSMVVTNDVALFVVVPLTMGLRGLVDLKLGRLVIFQALAVNAGSALSPIGNPQNLFLWQSAGTGFWEFLTAMLPLSAGLMLLLLLLVPFAFSSRPLPLKIAGPTRLEGKRPLLFTALFCYPLFLICADLGQAAVAAMALGLLYLIIFPSVLRGVDWLLLLVIILMFMDIGLLAQLAVLQEFSAHLDSVPGGVFTLGILLSQLISNVPATLLLEAFTEDWRALAWGVTVGGFGLAIGSLANLIALRLARVPGLWWEFHAWSLPALLVSAAIGGWLLG